MNAREDEAQAGAAIYSRPLLSIYDLLVLGFSNSYIWKCPSQIILDFYNQHISDRHLDVGVGTGYFLDKCRYPSDSPSITLADLNLNSLEVSAKRLRRFKPQAYQVNVLEPIHLDLPGFRSIGLNYVLHCLPGTMLEKGVAFTNLKSLLNPGGVLFGTTILGENVQRNFLARKLMDIYNARKIFSNARDNLTDLETILAANFSHRTLNRVGCVAFFAAQI